jgi:3',5'-cyclic-nucleotide phosphodiesterase
MPPSPGSLRSLIALVLLVPAAAVAAPPGGSAPEEGPRREPAFTAVVLGALGGLDESNLSAVLLGPARGTGYVLLDAGTVHAGLERAQAAGHLPLRRPEHEAAEDADDPPAATARPARSAPYFDRALIRAYFISHPHLDHVAGLVLNSPEDTAKSIYGLPETLDALRDHLFNGRVWPNFLDEGAPPQLNKYHLARLVPGREARVTDTDFSVEAWPLRHGGTTSSAFLVRRGEDYVLYLGDTGPDAVEKADTLHALWVRVAPLVRERRLRGIFVECSYPDPHAAAELHGHLSPVWLLDELRALATAVDEKAPAAALAGVPVVVMHRKPSLGGERAPDTIRVQLEKQTELKLKLVFPKQGQQLGL